MRERKILIKNKVGLHARPATMLVQVAKKFQADIIIECDHRQANAKSILRVLALGVSSGTEVILRVTGEDEEEALNTLCEIIDSDFGENELENGKRTEEIHN